jgi:hypothetical protein
MFQNNPPTSLGIFSKRPSHLHDCVLVAQDMFPKNNAQNTQYYSYFFPAMVEKNEAPSSKLNQYEQNNEE